MTTQTRDELSDALVRSIRRESARLLAERDALLAALKGLASKIGRTPSGYLCLVSDQATHDAFAAAVKAIDDVNRRRTPAKPGEVLPT